MHTSTLDHESAPVDGAVAVLQSSLIAGLVATASTATSTGRPDATLAVIDEHASISTPDDGVPDIDGTPNGLSANEGRALKGFFYLLNIKRNNLAANGHGAQQAAVSREEYRTTLCEVMRLSEDNAKVIVKVLIQQGHIAAQGSFLYEGNGIPLDLLERESSNEDFMPYNNSGRAFHDWLNERDRKSW